MRDVKGYEGLYAVTSCGKVWSYVSNKFLRPCYDKNGYILANLYKDKRLKTFKVHRLVAKAYIPNPDNLPQINHKDEVTSNNVKFKSKEEALNYKISRKFVIKDLRLT